MIRQTDFAVATCTSSVPPLPLSERLGQATIEERRRALRALLQRLLLTADGPSAVEFGLVRRHAEWLRRWLAQNAGWRLQVDAEVARLRKSPAELEDGARPARDVKNGAPFSRRRYVLLCLALTALERSDRQTTLGKVTEAVGDRGKVFATAIEYRREVDRALYGLGEHRFGALVKLLIQLRQPQLSRELNEKKLSEALSEALPPISESIIADVAESFRGLESEQKALDAFKAAKNGVAAFLTGYRRYAQIAARRRAEAVRGGHYEYESTMRRFRDAKTRRSTAEEGLGRVTHRLQQLGMEEQAASSRVATLADSPEMRSARDLDKAHQDVQQRQADVEAADDELQRAKNARTKQEHQQDETEKAADSAASDVQQASSEAQRYATQAGLEQEHRRAVEVLDLRNLSEVSEIPAAEQLLSEAASGRQKAVEHVRKLNRAIEQAENALATEKQVHALLSSQFDDAAEKQQKAHSLLQQAKAGLLEGYRSWFNRLSELKPPEPDDIAESVEAWCETGEKKGPIGEAADLAGQEAFKRLSELCAGSQRRLEEIEGELAELREARDRCAAGRHEPPPPPHTRDNATRETRLGGPLWLLCDFAPGVEARRRAGIEAALEASGLLDAWITPDGRLLAADEHDTVLIAGTSPAVSDDRHLGQILIPSVDRSDSRTRTVTDETVTAILRHIGIGSGTGNVWVEADGHWQVGPLHGAWSKPAEQHIGLAAREAERRRRLKALAVQITDRQREQATVRGDIDRIANREQVVRSELAQVPDGMEVLRARADVAAAAREVQDCRRRVAEVETRVVQKRRELETATKQRNLDARDLGIADRVDDLDALYDAIHTYLRALAGFWPKVEGYVNARNHAQAAKQRTAEAVEQENRFQHRLHETRKKVQEAIARCDALEAALGAPAQDIQKRLDEARRQLEAIRKEKDQKVERRGSLNTEVALGIQEIQTEGGKLEEDATRRQLAIDGLKQFAATKLLSLAAPNVVDEEPATWSVTKGVEIARKTEAALDEVDSDDAAWERNQKGIFRQIEELKETLLPYGHQPAATPEAVQGSVTLRDASAQQRAAIDRLFGRPASRGTSLTVRLDRLEAVLRHGELCDSLTEAIEVLTGPVKNLRAEHARREEQWAALFRQAEGRLDSRETLRRWLEDLRASGLLLRLSSRSVRAARDLLDQAIGIVTRLPVADVPLAELAAEATGNAHSLDAGQPLGTIVLRAVTILSGIEELNDAQARRDAWASVGVVCDELSASVLTLNLRADATSLTGQAAELYAMRGEPYRQTVRQLLRYPPSFDPAKTGHTAYVCENSTIVAAAADRLAAASAPLVCVEGEPNTAARVLLGQLAAADVRLAYHGDFDWKGIQIANLVMRRHGAVPWRFSTDDYLATSGGTTLQGSPVEASWDPHLQTAMSKSGRAVHEEQVLEDLIVDLATPPGKPAPQ